MRWYRYAYTDSWKERRESDNLPSVLPAAAVWRSGAWRELTWESEGCKSELRIQVRSFTVKPLQMYCTENVDLCPYFNINLW